MGKTKAAFSAAEWVGKRLGAELPMSMAEAKKGLTGYKELPNAHKKAVRGYLGGYYKKFSETAQHPYTPPSSTASLSDIIKSTKAPPTPMPKAPSTPSLSFGEKEAQRRAKIQADWNARRAARANRQASASAAPKAKSINPINGLPMGSPSASSSVMPVNPMNGLPIGSPFASASVMPVGKGFRSAEVLGSRGKSIHSERKAYNSAVETINAGSAPSSTAGTAAAAEAAEAAEKFNRPKTVRTFTEAAGALGSNYWKGVKKFTLEGKNNNFFRRAGWNMSMGAFAGAMGNIGGNMGGMIDPNHVGPSDGLVRSAFRGATYGALLSAGQAGVGGLTKSFAGRRYDKIAEFDKMTKGWRANAQMGAVAAASFAAAVKTNFTSAVNPVGRR